MRLRRAFLISLILLSLFLVACNIGELENSNLLELLEHPDMIFHQADYLLGLEEGEPLRIHAQRIETYKEQQKSILLEAQFTQVDSAGTLVLTGSAARVEIDTKNDNAQLNGAIIIKNLVDNIEIRGERLQWRDHEQLLTSGPDEKIELSYDNRYRIVGYGFTGSFSQATYEFLSIEEGEIVETH
jgi:LPS export ABC transporter protein LptC